MIPRSSRLDGCGVFGGRGREDYGKDKAHWPAPVGKSRQTLPFRGLEFARYGFPEHHRTERATVSILTDGTGYIGDLRERIPGSTLTEGAGGIVEILY